MGSTDRGDRSNEDRQAIGIDTGRASAEQRYHIEAEIGSGATSTVVRALDRFGQRSVALKILNTSIPTEWKTLAGLTHPSIVVLLDTGVIAYPRGSQPRPFIAMELLEGLPLKEQISEIQSPKLAVQIIQNVARALATAHQKKILHCDIKPSNIFVLRFSNGDLSSVKVLDFGLAAKITPGGVHAVGGTYAYMSPEQILNKKVDEASDVFSLGIVAYQLLTHRHPFAHDFQAATKDELSAAISTKIPVFICELNPSVSASVAAVIHKTLAKEPRDRPNAVDLPSLLEQSEVFKLERIEADKALRAIQLLVTEERLTEASDRLRTLERKGLAFEQLAIQRHEIDARLASSQLQALTTKAKEFLDSNDLDGALEVLTEAKGIPDYRFDIRVLRLEGDFELRQKYKADADDLLNIATQARKAGSFRRAEWHLGQRKNRIDALSLLCVSSTGDRLPTTSKSDFQDATETQDAYVVTPAEGEISGTGVSEADTAVAEILTLEERANSYQDVLRKALELLQEPDPDKRTSIAMGLEQLQDSDRGNMLSDLIAIQKRRQVIISNLQEQLNRNRVNGDIAGALEVAEALERVLPKDETASYEKRALESGLEEALTDDRRSQLQQLLAWVSELGNWETADRILSNLQAEFRSLDWHVKSQTVGDRLARQSKRDESIWNGLEYVGQHSLPSATMEFESALEADPENKPLAIALASLYLDSGRQSSPEAALTAQKRAQDLLAALGDGPPLQTAVDALTGKRSTTKAAAATPGHDTPALDFGPRTTPSIPTPQVPEPTDPSPLPKEGLPPAPVAERLRTSLEGQKARISQLRAPQIIIIGILGALVVALLVLAPKVLKQDTTPTAQQSQKVDKPPIVSPPIGPPVAPTRASASLSLSFESNLRNPHLSVDSVSRSDDFQLPVDASKHTFEVSSGATHLQFDFRGGADAAPEVSGFNSARNTSIIIVSSFGDHATVYSYPDRMPVILNNQRRGSASLEGLNIDLVATDGNSDNQLKVGDDYRQPLVVSNAPKLKVFAATQSNLGTLTIKANEDDARISLDGEELKRPIRNGHYTVNGIDRGNHVVTVAKDGFCVTPPSQKANVKSGTNSQISFNLQRFPSLRMVDLPNGAKITFDEKELVGSTLSGVSPGSHSIRIRAAGFEEFAGSLTFSCGEDTMFKGDRLVRSKPVEPPRPIYAKLTLSAGQTGARITMSGEGNKVFADFSKTLEVEPGTYRIHASLEGYQDYDESVSVRSGESKAIQVVLSRKSTAWSTPLTPSASGSRWVRATEFSILGSSNASGVYEFEIRKHGVMNPTFGNWILGYRKNSEYYEFKVQSRELQYRDSTSNHWAKIGDVDISGKTNSIFVRIRINGSTVVHEIGTDSSTAVAAGKPAQFLPGAMGMSKGTEISGFSH